MKGLGVLSSQVFGGVEGFVVFKRLEGSGFRFWRIWVSKCEGSQCCGEPSLSFRAGLQGIFEL